jgi:hypothetical protein
MFLQKLVKDKKIHEARAFNFTYRYIDDVLSINNSRFAEFLPLIIATGPCLANQLRDVNTVCRRSWYIAAHVWKIYDFKIEVVPFIINFSTDLTTRYQDLVEIYSVSAEKIISDAFSYSENV